MRGRELAFSDPTVRKLIEASFIPATGDDWYRRRRQDPVGRFFRDVAAQGPRKEAGGTRQGLYVLTASGKLLRYANRVRPEAVLDLLRRGLDAWKALPEAERRPGAVRIKKLSDQDRDARYDRRPPEDALIVKVYTRALDRVDGRLARCDPKGRQTPRPARDHLWLRRDEVRAALPKQPKAGWSAPLPRALLERILRFHCIDNTRGEPPMWRREEIRSAAAKLIFVGAASGKNRFRLEGRAVLADKPDPEKAARGFECEISGRIEVEAVTRTPTRFDLVAHGLHWGEGRYTPGARPGRQPLGIAFELCPKPASRDRVPPQGARDLGDYLRGS